MGVKQSAVHHRCNSIHWDCQQKKGHKTSHLQLTVENSKSGVKKERADFKNCQTNIEALVICEIDKRRVSAILQAAEVIST